MKKKLLFVLLTVCILLLGMTSLIACDDEPTPAEPATPQKLSAPVVVLNGSVASWEANANAEKFEISLNGTLSYVENTVTSVTLTDGQTVKVRAVGDGSTYATGDWSNSVTYAAPASGGNDTPGGGDTPGGSDTPGGGDTPGGSDTPGGGDTPGGSDTPGGGDTPGGSDTPGGTPDPTPGPGGEPAYLGIFASNTQPSREGGLPSTLTPTARMRARSGAYRPFDAVLSTYFANSENHLSATYPTASSYGAYSRAGEVVYVQIWLNNPSQHTILSLKLNGTKYQVGGGLSSFFIEEGDMHYNCVYVAVTIPTGAHTQTTYTVSEIEYIADTYINADGTDEFMNNNSTVSIGLPYNTSTPTVSDFAPQSLTVNSCAATLSVTDASGLVATTGGWLGIAVYDGENIIANKPLTLGSNSVSAGGLIEDTYYWVVVYLFADLHDGRGVTAHVLYQQSIQTPAAIEVNEIQGTLLYNTVKDGYYGAIKVQTTLNSSTAKYQKLEILDRDEQVIYTDNSYNGTAIVTDGICNGTDYTVRVYYTDTEYPEGRYIEENVWIGFLGTPWLQNEGVYSFVSDAIFYFELNNNDENYPAITNFTVRLRNESSARWIAADVLELIANENAIEEAQAKADRLHDEFMSMEPGPEQNAKHAEWDAARDRVQALEHARDTVDYRFDGNWDPAFWQEEAAKGKYFYELTYNGSNTDKIFKEGKTFFVLLEDAMTHEETFNYGSYRYEVEILYQYDNNEGNGLTDGRATYSLGVENTLTSCNSFELKDATQSGSDLTFKLANVGDWLIDDSEEEEGSLSYYRKAYVYQIFVLNNYNWDDKIFLYSASAAPALGIDEAAWIAEYIDCIKNGNDTAYLYAKYVPKYDNPQTLTLDLSALDAGQHRLYVAIRFINRDYAEGEYEEDINATIEIYKKLPTPTMTQNGFSAEVVVTDAEGWWGAYTFEAYDKSGNLVDYIGEGSYFQAPAAGTRVRVRLEDDGYWLQSDWSEWYYFDTVTAPTLTLSSSGHATWSVSDANVSGFVYRINNGGETSVDKDGECSADLTYGQTVFVKAIASEEARALGFEDSEWVSVRYERPSTGDKG